MPRPSCAPDSLLRRPMATNSGATLGQSFFRPGARRDVADRRNTKWPEPGRAARLPVRADPARRLHLAEVDKFIYPLRKAFPLVADALASTQTGPTVPIEAIEARNVVDGKKLVDQITKSGITAYPWGVAGLPTANPAEQTALNGAADALRNAYDAIADLALAEGVYQAVQGNYDRVASTIAAYTTGNFPPEPGIVDTAPPGIGLTHRFGIQFRPGLAAPAGATPRAQAEPAIDDWLAGMLPPLDHIACTGCCGTIRSPPRRNSIRSRWPISDCVPSTLCIC